MAKLSVIIPTRDEEIFLPTCLKSVAFADEILVIDSGSSDKTVEIAKLFGARVIQRDWIGYRSVHNFGAKEATYDWLLYVDADERVSSSLRKEIQKIITNSQAAAYQIPRKNFIMGKALVHGGWYPDKVTRLMEKSSLVEWVGELHEYPQITGKVDELSGELLHLTHRGVDWMLQKTRLYTQLSAQIMSKDGHPKVGVKNFFGAMAREFYFRAIKESGWRDGLQGWIEIFYQTFNAFLIQVHIWELQQKKSMSETYHQLDKKISDEL